MRHSTKKKQTQDFEPPKPSTATSAAALGLAPDRRASGDSDPAALPQLVRFNDLVAAGIVSSWQQLLRMMANDGFPAGIRLSRNVRAWPAAEIVDWLQRRPTERKPIAPRKSGDGEVHP
jgi:predicted DNA-binding transcriptional regulator AlpA